jgi:GntR family transcriptional regulator, phosphonate transport system regulatory protein
MSLYPTDRFAGAPLYRQIRDTIADELQRHYAPGMQLPPEPALAERFSVNRHTLRRAIDELVRAGIVERRRGRGVFVLDSVVAYGIHRHTRFTRTIEDAGNSAESIVLGKQVVLASENVARRLQVPDGTEVIWIETLRKVNDAPFSIVSHFIPAAAGRPLLDHYNGGSLHRCIFEHLGIRLERRLSLISTQLPQGDEASRLGISQQQPVLRVKSVNVDSATAQPVEYCLTRMRGDRVELDVRL